MSQLQRKVKRIMAFLADYDISEGTLTFKNGKTIHFKDDKK